jgi:S-adenosylmethionine:tRNA ribosyltransferase-isomerase
LQVSDFHYQLPEDLIAQEPLADRSASRMLVVSKSTQSLTDNHFQNFAHFLRPGDCLILNNTKVFPARLHGRRNHAQGAEVEVFLLKSLNAQETDWQCLVRPGKRTRKGDHILFRPDLTAQVLEHGEFGERTIRFSSEKPIPALLEEIGETPLPPYIHPTPNNTDKTRYQTVFAQHRGSVAAPTAGLHFTPQILDACRAAGADIAYVTLHVGLGTFAPLRAENISEIELHEEYFEIAEPDAARMRAARRRVCVGTTTVRTIETAMLRGGLHPMQGQTNLFIHPGYKFLATDALLTNFHLPQSSLLMLVSAFAGYDLTMRAYHHAVEQKYRFFSYGDCMFIEGTCNET